MALPDKEITRLTYESWAEQLAEHYDSMGIVGTRPADVERGFSLIPYPNSTVVEVGCGNGRDATAILQHTADYIGFDYSEEMIELARSANPEARFEVDDIATFHFPERTDLIFSFASLLHSDAAEVEDLFRRAHEALSSGGIFYVSSKQGHYEHRIKEDQFGTRIFYYYMPGEIKTIAEPFFETVYEDTQRINTTDWFTLALRKK